MAKKKQEQNQQQTFRQPIVAVMGHVDHGKTTFLDTVRGTRVVAKEAGGITQNTRMHEVTTKDGIKITFIDTPGHEAFSNMRERGSRVTDFVLLIVAADDGVQPQTKESIEFAKNNNVPVIVAINKVDIPGVDPQKIKTQLGSFGINIEEYGGETMCFEISAKENKGIDEVLEGIALMAEINELKPNEPKEGVVAEAFVLESNQDKHLGFAASCILKSGSLNEKLYGATQESIFKSRAYFDEDKKPLSEVNESQPFIVIGLSEDLQTGEVINFVETEKEAKDIQEKLKSGEVSEDDDDLGAEDLFAQLLVQRKEEEEGVKQKELNVILRASSQGTLEAVVAQLNNLETDDSKVNILQKGTGSVSDDDITMAKISKAVVLSFQVPVTSKIRNLAKREKVLVRQYEIIYNLVDELAEVLDGMEGAFEEEVEIARAKVKALFVLSDGTVVAGCEVTNGSLKKGHQIYIERDGGEDILEIGRGKIKELRQGKNEVREVKKNQECGILIDPNNTDIAEGDFIVAYKVEKS